MNSQQHTEDADYAGRTGFLSTEAFDEACRSLIARSGDYDIDGMSVRLGGEGENTYLVLTRPVLPKPSSPYEEGASGGNLNFNDEEQMTSLEDEDEDEAAVHHLSSPDLIVEYNVLLSPAYRVPVLYFLLRNVPLSKPNGIDAIYGFLVPAQYRSSLRDFGVMGGITMSNHPVTDMPVFFIHPCNTAEAMREVWRNREVTPLQYLQIWIGLFGACVGLHLPKELFIDSPCE